jgi:hypothetical protein
VDAANQSNRLLNPELGAEYADSVERSTVSAELTTTTNKKKKGDIFNEVRGGHF